MSSLFPIRTCMLGRLLLATALLAAALFTVVPPAEAAISGRYLAASGDSIVLTLDVPAGSSAIIVEQTIAAGNQVVATSPTASKVSARGVKWLFKNVQAGTITLTTRLSAPLRGGVAATVRYHQPGSGQFTELHIRP